MGWRLHQRCVDGDDRLADSPHHVLEVLCRHADDDTGASCFIALPLLAAKARVSERTVTRVLPTLIEGGWISWTQEPGKKRFYKVNVAKIYATPLLGAKTLDTASTPDTMTRQETVDTMSTPVTVSRVGVTPCLGRVDTVSTEENSKRTDKEKEIAVRAQKAHAPSGDELFGDELPIPTQTKVVEPAESKAKTKRGCRIEHSGLDLERLSDKLRAMSKALVDKAGITLDLDLTYANFVDHWKSTSGAKACKLDWEAAWRTWIRNEIGYQQRRQPAAGPQRNGHQPERFTTDYYRNSKNPDGTINWGI